MKNFLTYRKMKFYYPITMAFHLQLGAYRRLAIFDLVHLQLSVFELIHQFTLFPSEHPKTFYQKGLGLN